MPADPNIFQQFAQPVRSVEDYLGDMDTRESNKLKLAAQRQQGELAGLQMEQTKAGIADAAAKRNAIQDIYAKLGPSATPRDRATALQGNPLTATEGVAAEKAIVENAQKASLGAKEQAEADAKRADMQYAAVAHHAQGLPFVREPKDIIAYVDEGIRKGAFPAEARDAMLQRANGFKSVDEWRQAAEQAATPALERLKMQAEAARAKLQSDTQVQTTKMNNDTSRANTASNNATTMAGHRMSQQTQFATNGLDKTGQSQNSGDDLAGLVDAIGTGKAPITTALSRLSASEKAQVMKSVAEKFPGFDPTDYAQRNKAAIGFGTGKQGDTVRSLSVASSHLDTLSQLSDALNNGNVGLINKIGNLYNQQTGKAAPTNFEAAKQIVADEVVKAVIGSGAGALADREHAAAQVKAANSPAQLKGVISTYRQLMEGQLQGLEDQYSASTGRSDFKTKFRSGHGGQAAPAPVKSGTDLGGGFTVK